MDNLRTASCCKVEVVKGAAALRVFLFLLNRHHLSGSVLRQRCNNRLLLGFVGDRELFEFFALELRQSGHGIYCGPYGYQGG